MKRSTKALTRISLLIGALMLTMTLPGLSGHTERIKLTEQAARDFTFTDTMSKQLLAAGRSLNKVTAASDFAIGNANAGQIYKWRGPWNGNWGEPNHWSPPQVPPQVPGEGDTVILDALGPDQIGGTINLDQSRTVAKFVMRGDVRLRSRDAKFILTITDEFTWSEGAIHYDANIVASENSVVMVSGDRPKTLGGWQAGTGSLTINGKGSISGSGPFKVETGGTLTVGSTGELTVDKASPIVLSGGFNSRLDILGTAISAGAGGIEVNDLGTITVSGALDLRSNAGLNTNCNCAMTVNAGGKLLKSAGTETSSIGLVFNNSGTVSAQSGTLAFINSFTQSAGSTILAGGIIKLDRQLDLLGGAILGAGVIEGTVVNDGGTISPGIGENSPGTLTITGSYTQTSSGRLEIEIGGRDRFDRIIITNPNTNLAGTLDLSLRDGYQPKFNERFAIVEVLSRPEFSIGQNDIGNGRSFTVEYVANKLELVANGPANAPDGDADGVPDVWDNCADDANENQDDRDGDRIGDACDDDADGDGVNKPEDSDDLNRHVCRDADTDTCEDCSSGTSNPANDGPDRDLDGLCNLGDPDDDNDGVNDPEDSAPLNRRVCRDIDTDRCDECSSGTISDPANDGPDRDGDGRCNAGDNCTDHPNPDQANNDADSAGDACDADDDNDGVFDKHEIACGTDPFNASSRSPDDLDRDSEPDCFDKDDDGDGVPDDADNCPRTFNSQSDADGDGIGDVCDPDDDNDGTLDDSDTDDDNDDVPDAEDAFPLNPEEWLDTDGDGIGNNTDPDDDGDGISDALDNCQLNANVDQRDRDGDLIGNACDPIHNPNVHIVFSDNRNGDLEIYGMRANRGGVVRLTKSPGDDIEPALSPDRTKIAFTSTRDGNYEIYTMDLDGTCVKRLTNVTSVDRNPAWSPDGRKIAFTSTRDGNSKIYSLDVVNCTDPTIPVATRLNEQVGIEPAWSPNGDKIAFTGPGSGGNYTIFSMSADGSDLRPLTTSNAHNFHPTWSPDGSRIAFIKLVDPTNQLYTMNPNGTDEKLLFNLRPVSEPAWGANNKIVFRSTIGQEIYRVNSDGTGLTRMTNHPAYDGWPHW